MKKIVCGDLNLVPTTESIQILEKDMRNLITAYNITSTRSTIYTKEIKYADYVFTSSTINVKEFYPLDHTVSDHLPLYLHTG